MQHSVDARWLHVSDFHVKAGQSYDRDRVMGALIKSIPALYERTGSFDFIVASGDIAHSGQPLEYKQATLFFDDLLAATGVSKERLIVIPGNHDVDRAYNSTFSRTINSTQEADRYFAGPNPLQHLATKMSAFIDWYNNYFSGIYCIDTRTTTQTLEDMTFGGGRIRFSLVNSALFSAGEDDHGKLVIGRKCLEECFQSATHAQDAVRFTVIHHPLSWISHIEAANIKALLGDYSDIVMSGHLHEIDVEQAIGMNGETLFLAAGATYQGSNWPNTASICHLQNGTVEVLPIQFVDRPRPTWTIDPSVFPTETTFSKKFDLKRLKGPDNVNGMQPSADLSQQQVLNQAAIKAYDDWQSDLFQTSDDGPIYIEPRLFDQPQNYDTTNGEAPRPLSIEEIINSETSYLIECRSEYGGSNLAKRLKYEIIALGKRATLREASAMPTYKAKIIQEFVGRTAAGASTRTFIIDNFDLERDSRLLRELGASGIADRVILIATNREIAGGGFLDISGRTFAPNRIFLWPMSRQGLRTATSSVFGTDDPVFVSSTVDKVYSDLLALCIPLTPPNSIMYLRVLVKETDFTPLNRVHIQNKFISEALSRSSDIYRGNFNAKNKIDIVATFAHRLFIDRFTYFNHQRWFSFATAHKEEMLKEFDEASLLKELVDVGIFGKSGQNYFFKYSFFYSFFLGRYLASNRSELQKFLQDEHYLEATGVIDVVSGLEADNSLVLQKLCDELQIRLDEFAARYVKADFDPLLTAVWPDRDDEEDKLWNPVFSAIEDGPHSLEQIDEIKSSALAEARTADQQVIFKKFSDLEHSLFVLSIMLADALRNSDEAPAALKLKALDLILRSELVAFQVGTLFADKLASNTHFRWGAVSFTDFNKVLEEGESVSTETVVRVVIELSQSVALKISSEIGTYKLSNVFRTAAKDERSIDFLFVVLFACILEAKGSNWHSTLEKIILRTKRDAFYLSTMLRLLMQNISMGLEKGRDLEEAKRLVAIIQSKRGYKKMAPGERLINDTLKRLEKNNEFDFREPTESGG